MTRRIHVALLPSQIDPPMGVAIVVDVVRASTTLVTLMERGCVPILLATTVDIARRAAARDRTLLLIGEEGGLPPEGFDYGNSPADLARAPLAGRGAVVVTTNGVPAIHAAAGAEVVLVGCLRNAASVATAAWDAGGAEGRITIICAARPSGFGLDDAYCAGVLVERLMRLGEVELSDAAEAARMLALAEPDPRRLLGRSAAGRYVTRLGLAADVDYAAGVDTSTAVPRLGHHFSFVTEPVEQ